MRTLTSDRDRLLNVCHNFLGCFGRVWGIEDGAADNEVGSSGSNGVCRGANSRLITRRGPDRTNPGCYDRKALAQLSPQHAGFLCRGDEAPAAGIAG